MKIEHGVKILFSISMVLLIGVFSGACIASAGLDCECVKKVDCKKGTELDIQEVETLPSYRANPERISVSGLSAGAYMADQLFVAYSKTFIGAGIFAGGPYYCSEGNLSNATGRCMADPSQLDNTVLKKFYDKAKGYAKEGKIDSLDNLKNRKIYIFSGKNDKTVKQEVTDRIDDFYKLAGVPDSNIFYKNDINTVHLLPTMCYGSACDLVSSGPPWMGDCDYEGAGKALEHIYGTLNNSTCLTKDSGTFIKFHQNEFFTPQNLSKEDLKNKYSFNEFGYAYVPKSCQSGGCGIHVVLHGCKQIYDRDPSALDTEPDKVGDPFGLQMVLCAGYNEYANTNNLIILYPQAQKVGFGLGGSQIYNPRGCFDWWGYIHGTTDTYATKEGPQMKAIYAMVARIEGPTPPECPGGYERPVITLKKTPEDRIDIEIKVGGEPIDPGATAFSEKYGDLTPKIERTGNVDQNKTGTYEWRYNVADTEGCKAKEEIRKVSVQDEVSCKEWTATLADHENAGRVYSKPVWIFFKNYYTVGTNTYIPGYSWSTVTLYEKSIEPGKYYLSCI